MSVKNLLFLFSSILLILVIGLLWNGPIYGNDEVLLRRLIKELI
ncbi:Uncharacterised protein [Niallia circulans]|jgi:hypothetical protein|nr:Uncharacterised protein [Niallia circulans]